jgi:pimeloyl-ACP methyl ester carboxylesterase
MVNCQLKRTTALAMSLATLMAIGCKKAALPVTAGSGTAKSADGVPIAYEVKGQGPMTLVFVHGWSCDRNYWRKQIDAFTSDHRVVLLDLAGHGTSGKNRTDWSIANFANDVAAVVRAVNVSNVVLIGHSLGGPVALEAGLLLPDRVRGVIGVEAFYDAWADPGFAKMLNQLRPNFAAGTRAFVRKAMFLPTSPAPLADSIASAMAAAPPEIALPSLDSLLAWSRDRQDKAASALRAPAGLILVTGGKAATARFQRARGNQPSLGVDEIAGTGHFLMLEVPEAFNKELRAMVTRIHSTSASQ